MAAVRIAMFSLANPTKKTRVLIDSAFVGRDSSVSVVNYIHILFRIVVAFNPVCLSVVYCHSLRVFEFVLISGASNMFFSTYHII